VGEYDESEGWMSKNVMGNRDVVDMRFVIMKRFKYFSSVSVEKFCDLIGQTVIVVSVHSAHLSALSSVARSSVISLYR
jgi:hypothetical protein